MSNNKMLIDATHPEETRVVVLRSGRVEEFDYESAARKLLRGNIYLAKVTRVEPSLQAAFVDYGGNRHGFLAFNEIHPDYYQIPMADRLALIEEEAAAEAREEAEADARAERLARRRPQRQEQPPDVRHHGQYSDETGESVDEETAEDHDDDDHESTEPDHDDEEGPRTLAEDTIEADETIVEEMQEPETVGGFEPSGSDERNGDDESAAEHDARGNDHPAEIGLVENEGVQVVATAPSEPEAVEQTGAEDALEELPSRPRRRPRSYKIQEVIKRRQIILVQVVKEERGTKGAALTTYLSLAGRYTVLMPNTARGGGISRKITNPQDRKRLKAIAAELEVPEGMGLIIRTAGAARTKQEIKRDFEYLLRLWESVREMTLQSTAPSLVYEEGNLIKRSIRDLYNKDVEEIVVAGEHAYRDAREFMGMLMPSHAKNVILHSENEPLFTRFGIERQLNAMFSPYVTLRSGGYLVINQTEALVAIDVNSGKSTREFSIEETAHNTNLEAADEIARQLKLRDLAGLIVIDFIDMEEKRNNRSVERRLKDALRFDRARIQLGRISHFGLMEMSRQRLRTGVLEGSTSQCPHCQGTGIIRSTESVALAVLRGIEDALMGGARTSLVATTTATVAIYLLNNKRNFINDMEARHGISIAVHASDKMQGANFSIERGTAAVQQPVRRPERTAVSMDWGFDEAGQEDDAEADAAPDSYDDDASHEHEQRQRGGGRDEERGDRDERGPGRRRRRRRRGRRGNGERSHEGREPMMRNEQTQPASQFGTEDSEPAEDDVHVSFEGELGLDDQPAASGHDDDAIDTSESNGHQQSARDGGRRRRRGRRGGRRGRDRESREQSTEPASHVTEEIIDDFGGAVMPDDMLPQKQIDDRGGAADARPSERRGERRSERTREQASPSPAPADAAPAAVDIAGHTEDKPSPRSRNRHTTTSEPKLERVVVSPSEKAENPDAEPAEPKRGWWQRRLGG